MALQVSGAILWGIFFSVATDEVVIFGAPLWIPLLVWREYRRARKYGFFIAFAVRVLVVAAVVSAATYYPAKNEDRRTLEGLSGTAVTLSEIQEKSRFRIPDKWAQAKVTLPCLRPTLRQTIQAIETQTPLKCRIGRCGNGMSPLWGGHIIFIQVSET